MTLAARSPILGVMATSRRTRSHLPSLTLPLLLAACGDDARTSDGASASNTSNTSVASETAGTAGTVGESDGTDTAGSGSNSMTAAMPTTTLDPPTTDGTTSVGMTSGTSGSTGGVDLPTCNQEPPPAMMGPFDESCAVEPQQGMFNPVVEWHKDTWVTAPSSRASVTTPVVAQITDDNGDGKIDPGDMPDVIYITFTDTNGTLRAVSGDGSKELLSVTNPNFWRNQSVSAGDIDGDGVVEIITKGEDQKVYAYEHDGTLKWTSASLGTNTGIYDSIVSISDMNGDGSPELVCGRAILDNNGVIIGAGKFGIGKPAGNANADASMSFAVDLDGDGEQEVVVGDALYNAAGAAKWNNGLADGFPATIDLELDGQPEIVVVYNGKVRTQRHTDGSVVWDVAVPGGRGGPPTVADFDGDGLPEIGIAAGSKYTVFDTDGTALWTAATQDASSAITGSSVYDFEGDGIADVVYADEINLYVFSGNDGTVKLKFTPHNSGTRLELPVIADLDGDDQVEIAFVSEPGAGGNYQGLTVLGDMDKSWRPGRKIWNQHTYHITNVADDGTIPAVADLNWLSYNNFRSGDLSANDGLAAPDLVMLTPETCVSTCAGPDTLALWVQLGNAGAAPLTAGADVEVYGTVMGVESLMKSVPFVDVLAPGEYAAAFSIEIETAGLEQLRVVAKAKEAECKIDADNEIVLMPPFCTAPG